LIIDPSNGEIIEANRTAEKYYGYTRQQLLNLNIADINILSSKQIKIEMNLAKSENRDHFFFKHRLANKSIRDVEVHSGPIHWDHRKALYSIIHDISDRKLAEEALRKSEERFALAMKGTNDGLWDWDLKTNIIIYSERWKSMLGYADDELENHYESWKKLVHPGDIKQAKESIEDYLNSKSSKYEAEFRMLHKKGHWVHILARGYAVWDKLSNKPIRFVGTHVDLSEVKKAENALQQAKEQIAYKEKEMRLLLNSTHEGIYGIDLEGDCTFANQSCLDILGYDSVDELIGKNMHDQIHHHYEDGSFYPVEQCYIFKAFQDGKGTTKDNEVLWRKDGSYFSAEYNSYPIFDKGHAIGAVVSFTDITERKIAEEKIQLSEEKYRLAMEATQDGLWDWNIATGDVYYSPGWSRTLGEDSLKNNYSSWEQRIYNADKKRVLVTLKDHLAGNTEIWKEEHRLIKFDKTYVWVLGRGKVVKRDKNGKPLRMIGTMTDIHDKKKNEELIWHQANYDTLTSLPNRKLFQELLSKGIQKSQRDKEQLWLLFLDLDGFKEINDSFGHHQGDELLVLVSDRIQSILRESDTISRLGGDEFVIMLHEVNTINDIDRIASNIINIISEPYKLGEDIAYITTSIGIANYPNDANNATDLLKFADQSMYAAKKEGKNRYTYFTQSLQLGSLLRIKMYAELHKAITNNEFQMYYQPIINLTNDKIHKAEALIRWQHPEKGFLNPGSFIQFAEETGIICDIGIWIFENAFKQLNNWQSIVSDDFQLSINMSPLQLKTNDKKYELWMDKVNTSYLSGKNIVIEITEGLLIKDDPIVLKKLIRFRDAGIQVAIDDFGTGYSSLSYIKEFDIDYLKIDQSFVCNLEANSIEESLCQAIVVMG